MPKRFLGTDVLSAARERMSWIFDRFNHVCVSFSGGKDSTVVLHLAADEARRRGRRIGTLFIDWECQFSSTIDHVREMFARYSDIIDPYWVALPIRTVNGCSQTEPEWTAWDPAKRELWVREPDAMSISDPGMVPFHYPAITFEEFVPLFAKWFGRGEPSIHILGIRAAESLNRWRAIAGTVDTLDGKPWTTRVVDDAWNAYPIYDWSVADDWTYIARTGLPYNRLYDRMHAAGMTPHQMRIDEPFGDTQRISLWLYQVIEPKLWAKMVARVAGANTGALYSTERGNILGVHSLKLPPGKTWESFARLLLDTMPPRTAEHYKNKIAKYLHWYSERGYPDGIPDEAPAELETQRRNLVPSWRLVCKTLLRNDYWCSTLGFSPTKSSAYQRYLDLMRRKRDEWKLFPTDKGANDESTAAV